MKNVLDSYRDVSDEAAATAVHIIVALTRAREQLSPTSVGDIQFFPCTAEKTKYNWSRGNVGSHVRCQPHSLPTWRAGPHCIFVVIGRIHKLDQWNLLRNYRPSTCGRGEMYAFYIILTRRDYSPEALSRYMPSRKKITATKSQDISRPSSMLP